VTEEPNSDVAPGKVFDQNPAADQSIPKGSDVEIIVSSGAEKATVPDVRNKDADVAANELGQAGLKSTQQKETSDSVDEGKVIRTQPSQGTRVDRGSTVTMVVSSGPPTPQQVTVPDVIGRTQAQATSALQSAGFKVKVEQQAVLDDADDGRVLDQSPNGGTQADEGSTVTITVGKKTP
jgi:serine/threonine-protein kinase